MAPSALQSLQVRFCLIDLGGEIRIVDQAQIRDVLSGRRSEDISFYKKQDGEMLMRRHLEAQAIPSDPKKTIPLFWVDPSTHVYNAVAFSPLMTPLTTLTYWTGPTINPQPGNWLIISDFLREVICDASQEAYEYLIRYLAHMLQKPEQKPGIIVVLLGRQGTGKGVFFSLLRAIWNRTSLLIQDVDQVLGRFNSALERHVVVCMDEAIFTGDKKAIEHLKSLITEPQCRIEKKYQPTRTIDSYHRFFAASNNSHFAHVDLDDRRFLFLRVSSRRQGDVRYFANLTKAIHDENVIGAMVHDLLKLDISKFDVRDRPKTREHRSQKLQSLLGFERYWYELLTTGMLGGTLWERPIFVSTNTLRNVYKEYDRNADRYRTMQSQAISACIEKYCPSAIKNRKKSVGTQERGYQLPHIDVARREFDNQIGGRGEWDWENVEKTSKGSLFTEDQLDALREAYDLSDGTTGPADDLRVA
jgi:hypothetical protein